MRVDWSSIKSWLRSCPTCGRYFIFSGYLCENCENELIAQILPRTRDLYVGGIHLEVSTLWDWWPGDGKLGKLLYSLKGTDPANYLAYLSEILNFKCHPISLSGSAFSPFRFAYLVESRERLHSQKLAMSFALNVQRCGERAELIEILPTVGEHRSQKRRGLRQRLESQTKFRVSDGSVELLDGITIFADDVVTTGGTSVNVARALGKKSLKVWALAYRCRLPQPEDFAISSSQ